MLPFLLLMMPGVVLAANITAQFDGSVQGQFQCGNTAAGQVGTAVVTGLDLGVEIPTDSSGRPSGKTVTGPVTIIKPFDSCTPQLLQAATTNERMTVRIQLFSTNPATGAPFHALTILLDTAQVISVGVAASVNPNGAPVTNEEDSFSYQQMTMTDEVSGKEVVVKGAGSSR